MPASKHQLTASAYHLKTSDIRKLFLAATNFRDRCLLKTLWWVGVPNLANTWLTSVRK